MRRALPGDVSQWRNPFSYYCHARRIGRNVMRDSTARARTFAAKITYSPRTVRVRLHGGRATEHDRRCRAAAEGPEGRGVSGPTPSARSVGRNRSRNLGPRMLWSPSDCRTRYAHVRDRQRTRTVRASSEILSKRNCRGLEGCARITDFARCARDKSVWRDIFSPSVEDFRKKPVFFPPFFRAIKCLRHPGDARNVNFSEIFDPPIYG